MTPETFSTAATLFDHCIKETRTIISQYNKEKNDIIIANDQKHNDKYDDENEDLMGAGETTRTRITRTQSSSEIHTNILCTDIGPMLLECSDDIRKKWNSLGECLTEMSALLAAAVYERVYLLVGYSVRALMSLFSDIEGTLCGVESLEVFSGLLLETIR